MKDEKYKVILLLGCTVLFAGCNDAGDAVIQQPARVELTTGESVDVEWDGGQAQSLRTASGDIIPFSGGEAKVGEQLVVQSAPGKIEVVRKPNAIASEINALPCLYLKEGTLEELVTDGFQGDPYIGPGNALYWIAHTCTNSACQSGVQAGSERPRLFINRMPGVWVTASGTLASQAEMPDSLIQPCPVCGRTDHVVVYELPDAQLKKQTLHDELARVRAVRDQASKSH